VFWSIGVNPGGLGVATPPYCGLGVVGRSLGVLGGRGRGSEKTIVYLHRKRHFSFFSTKEIKISQQCRYVGVKGENVNIWGEKTILLIDD